MKTKTDIKFKLDKQQAKEIFADFTFDEDNMDYDDITLSYIHAYQQLDVADRMILALYAEFQSQRKTADVLGVSRTTVIKCLNKIRKQIEDIRNA